MRSLIFISLLLTGLAINAAPIATFKFDNDQQEELFHKLSQDLRCLVCQNNSIGDSNADLAKDLRNEMYGMIIQGKNEQQIVDFMVQRYGDFVLYNPPMKPLTWVLWFGPAIIFVIALFYALRIIKAQRSDVAPQGMKASESERLKRLQAEAERTSHRQDQQE